MREKGSSTRLLFESWFATVGGTIGRTIELEYPDAAKALVAAQVGISFLSVHGLRAELRQGRFVKLSIKGLKLKRPIFLIRHPDKRISPVTDAFLSTVPSHTVVP